MNVDELRSRLKSICENHRISRLDLFGSRARSEALEGGDFDFLARIETDSPKEYAETYFQLLEDLEENLGEPVDLLTPSNLSRQSLVRNIEKEKICIYER